jgi:hypothetical protein
MFVECKLAALVYDETQDPDAVLREFAADLRGAGGRKIGGMLSGKSSLLVVCRLALSRRSAQCFLSIHAAVQNSFKHHITSRGTLRVFREEAFCPWRAATAA